MFPLSPVVTAVLQGAVVILVGWALVQMVRAGRTVVETWRSIPKSLQEIGKSLKAIEERNTREDGWRLRHAEYHRRHDDSWRDFGHD